MNNDQQQGRTPLKRDWIVDCNDCPARYTPKARQKPQECYACGSGQIKSHRRITEGYSK